MYKDLKISNIQIYFYLLLLTLNVPLQIGKCTPRGTCTPGCEPLLQIITFEPETQQVIKVSKDLDLSLVSNKNLSKIL